MNTIAEATKMNFYIPKIMYKFYQGLLHLKNVRFLERLWKAMCHICFVHIKLYELSFTIISTCGSFTILWPYTFASHLVCGKTTINSFGIIFFLREGRLLQYEVHSHLPGLPPTSCTLRSLCRSWSRGQWLLGDFWGTLQQAWDHRPHRKCKKESGPQEGWENSQEGE